MTKRHRIDHLARRVGHRPIGPAARHALADALADAEAMAAELADMTPADRERLEHRLAEARA
jgi:histidinol-phosphate/aromatic aminotransferase/cobyric acid decarboxylase-like protein